MIIAIDFDGTCVAHEFPKICKEIGAEPVLKQLVKEGHKLVLNTMRSDKKDVNSTDYNIHGESGDYLTQAVNWFKKREIPLYGINENPTQKSWTDSPKVYADLYIDDAALGCPLHKEESGAIYVDWVRVFKILVDRGIIFKK